MAREENAVPAGPAGRELILKKVQGHKLRTTEADYPDLGGRLGLRSMPCGVRDKFDRVVNGDLEYVGGARVFAVINSVCDADGKLIFKESDAPAFAMLDSVVLEPLFQDFIRLNKLGKEEAEAAEGN